MHPLVFLPALPPPQHPQQPGLGQTEARDPGIFTWVSHVGVGHKPWSHHRLLSPMVHQQEAGPSGTVARPCRRRSEAVLVAGDPSSLAPSAAACFRCWFWFCPGSVPVSLKEESRLQVRSGGSPRALPRDMNPLAAACCTLVLRVRLNHKSLKNPTCVYLTPGPGTCDHIA